MIQALAERLTFEEYCNLDNGDRYELVNGELVAMPPGRGKHALIIDALNDIQLKGYQSDTRLAANIISSTTGKYGKSVVKRKCLEKGIAADVFEQNWLEQAETEETGELVSLKAKVMRKYKIDDFHQIEPKTKAKLWNYLKYRGFNPFEVLEQWQREEIE